MNSSVKRRCILLVEPSDSAIVETSERIKAHRLLAEYHLVGVLESEALEHLQVLGDRDEAPDVVLIGAQVGIAAHLTQALRRLKTDPHLVFVVSSETEPTTKIDFSRFPLLGLSWTTASLVDPSFADTVHQAAQAAVQRRRLRSTITKANTQLSSFQAAAADRRNSAALSEYYLTNFLAHAQDAIVALDSYFTVLYWSAGAERLFGRSDHQTIGTSASDLPFWSPELERHLANLQVEQGNVTVESSASVAERQLMLESVCSAVRDEQGRFLGSSLVIRDVTERHKQLEAERAEQLQATRIIDGERRHLRSLFKQAPGFIAVTTGSEHIFEVVNDAYLEIVGERDILGKPVTEALPEMRGQQFLELLNQAFSSGEPFVGRGIAVALQRQPDSAMETLYVDFIFQPIVQDDGKVTGIFCQGSDITEHKHTQEQLAQHQTQLEDLVEQRTLQLEKSQQALQRSQKLEAIGQLTGGVAHDFNNVLQIISSNLQLLQIGNGEHAEQQAFLRAAVGAVERGTKLSSQLLAFARRQPLQPIALNLTRVLRGMDDLLRRALGETIEIETIVGGGLWNTMVDPNQLENVILNLAINARDAMPSGGRLTLELGNAMLDDRYVSTQPDVPAGQYVLLAVSDTGKGMEQEVIERAFDPFFTTKSEGTGTGLGLSMAYGFVKQSGGHIRIYSELGSGTTFKIYLPRCFESEVEFPRPSEGPVVGGSETILVVEDDPAVQDAAVRTLGELGYQVLRAGDGQSALNVLQSGVAVDMLFTDVVMPGPVRSPDLARQAKQMLPDIAVLFTSGYTQNAIVHAGRLDPGVELLSKPYRREDLARKIRQVLADTQRDNLTAPAPAEAPKPSSATEAPLRILVVEDDAKSREAICNLLSVLGHQVTGAACAESALAALQERFFELLLTDIKLPGMSGLELARQAVQEHAQLRVVISSGYGSVVEHDLPFTPIMLPKPFDLVDLQQALGWVKKST